MKYFIHVRGAGERHRNPNSMLNQVAELLNPDIRSIEIDYPASISVANPTGNVFGVALNESRARGIASLEAVVENIITHDMNADIVLGGYSLGSLVVNSYLLGAKASHLLSITAAVQIANPARSAGSSVGRDSWGLGITGETEARHPIPVFNIASPGDGITSLHPKSPLRNVVPWMYGLTLGNAHAWVQDVMSRVEQGIIRLVPAHFFDAAWRDAANRAPGDVIGYAFLGNHTVAYGRRDWKHEGRNVNAIELAAHIVNGV